MNRRIAIIGGGLAGMATAVSLVERGLIARGGHVTLFERLGRLGGRVASFYDPVVGRRIDLCRHAMMGCCTQLARMNRTLGVDQHWQPVDHLTFITSPTQGNSHYKPQASVFRASRWLPAPLHLLPALLQQKHLSLAEQFGVARAMRRLVHLHQKTLRTAQPLASDIETIGNWLRAERQSDNAMRRFWAPVVIGALSETLDRASTRAAAHLFHDGFMASRDAHRVYLSDVPLGAIYHDAAYAWLVGQGVEIRMNTPVKHVAEKKSCSHSATATVELRLSDGSIEQFDRMVVATAWHQVERLLPDEIAKRLGVDGIGKNLVAAPISAVHLWLDRPITGLPHAVMVDENGDWLFRRELPDRLVQSGSEAYYHQVVVSASHQLTGLSREEVLRRTLAQLARVWPETQSAELLHHRVVNAPRAVFSMQPETDQYRPQPCEHDGPIVLAGDWTFTHWPATMEGAVRSGRRAAELLSID